MNLDFRASGEAGVFSNMPNLETIDLSNLKSDSADVLTANITGLNGLIFNNSPKLANITIAGPIPTIPAYAFKGCTGLQNVDFTQLPNITTIGRGAFQNTTIETVDLSACKKLTTIDQDAFRDANVKLLDLSACEALTTINRNAFTGVALNAETPLKLTLPATLVTIDNNAFYGSNITELVFPENSALQTIGSDSFRNSKLTKLDFTNCASLRSIGNNTFQGTSKLTSLKFADNSNVSLGSGLFQGSGLTTADLSNTAMTSLSNQLFKDCASLVDLKLPNTINTIGVEALRGTSSLTKLDLSNITSNRLTLNNNAFYGSGFVEIKTSDATGDSSGTIDGLIFGKNKEIIIGNYVFSSMPKLTKVVFESTSTTNSTNGTMSPVQNMFDSSAQLATIDLSKCQLPIVGQNGNNGESTACFRGTAVKEIKIGNYKNAEVVEGQLLLADNISTIKN